jgi:cobalt-zinc-cadmium efflux system protein
MGSGIRQMSRAFLTLLIVLVVQVLGFLYSNSLALLGDTGHVLSDIIAMGASLTALWLASRAPTARRTFGYHRAEVFVALFNGALLVIMALFIANEAMLRIGGMQTINSIPMLLAAFFGLAGNLYVVYHLQHEENLNIRSAFLHAAGDALSSIGVIIGAVVIFFTGMVIADAIVSFLISVIILFSAYRIIRSSLSILMESAPYGIDAKKIEKALNQIKSVRGVHDIHVWRTCSDMVYAMMHVETDNVELIETREIADRIEEKLKKDFNISHSTIQFEPYGCSCENRGMCEILKKKH